MLYQEVKPSPILAPFVKCYWITEMDVPAGGSYQEYISPTGYPQLLFSYGESHTATVVNNQYHTTQRYYLVGQASKGFSVESQRAFQVIGVIFHPAGLFPFIRIPLFEFTDQFFAVDQVEQPGDRELLEQFENATSNVARIAIVEQFLERRIFDKPFCFDFTQHAVALIQQYNGNITVQEVATKLRVSTRHLHRMFEQKVGLNPKLYARIVRFNYVIKLLKQYPNVNYYDLSFECGFFDQAHFIKNFREFTHRTLTNYHQTNSIAMVNFTGR
jgi:AraC-like DNA-binding protein